MEEPTVVKYLDELDGQGAATKTGQAQQGSLLEFRAGVIRVDKGHVYSFISSFHRLCRLPAHPSSPWDAIDCPRLGSENSFVLVFSSACLRQSCVIRCQWSDCVLLVPFPISRTLSNFGSLGGCSVDRQVVSRPLIVSSVSPSLLSEWIVAPRAGKTCSTGWMRSMFA